MKDSEKQTAREKNTEKERGVSKLINFSYDCTEIKLLRVGQKTKREMQTQMDSETQIDKQKFSERDTDCDRQ